MHFWRNKVQEPLQKVSRMLLATLVTSKRASKGVPNATPKTHDEKHALCLFPGRLSGANEPWKVLISSRTSFKNQVFKQSRLRPLPNPFGKLSSPWRAFKMRPQRVPKSKQEPCISTCWCSCASRATPMLVRGGQKGLENESCSHLFIHFWTICSSICTGLEMQ